MSHQKQLEKVLELLLAEDTAKAAEVHHQIIVEMARKIYEQIVDEESDDDDVGGDASEDFTDKIESHEDEIDADEENNGEASDDDEMFGDDEETGGDVEDRVEDLEDQLEALRAEFDALMGEEMDEPYHDDLGDKIDDIQDQDDMDPDMGDDDYAEKPMFEKKRDAKLEKAPQAKDRKRDKKVDEETQFLTKVADTGQRGTAKFVGTGKGATLGAENTKSPYTSVPARKDYGGKPTKIGGDGGSGGDPGKYRGEKAKDGTISNNMRVEPRKASVKADSTAKFTNGKSAGDRDSKSPIGSK